MLYKEHAIYSYFQSWVKIDKVNALSIFLFIISLINIQNIIFICINLFFMAVLKIKFLNKTKRL
jgi:hypothetical protein|nr:MAG TPA: hypothetical protein [Caudoviricetes sp.]